MIAEVTSRVSDGLSEEESFAHGRPYSSTGSRKKWHSDMGQKRSKTSLAESPPPVRGGASLNKEIQELARRKQEVLMKEREPESWKETIRTQIEEELEQRVREALSTPPLERIRRNRERARQRYKNRLKQEQQQTPVTLSLDQCREYSDRRPSRIRDILRTKFSYTDDTPVSYRNTSGDDKGRFRQKYSRTPAHQEASQEISRNGLQYDERSLDPSLDRHRNRALSHNGKLGDSSSDDDDDFVNYSARERDNYDYTHRAIRRQVFNRYTREGFRDALKHGKNRDGTKLRKLKDGKYIDCNGVILTFDGPFWPSEHGPLYPKPDHGSPETQDVEPLSDDVPHHGQTIHNQKTRYSRRWDRVISVFDSERTTKGSVPHDVPEGCAPSLMFESRFESGNLRQARRIGQFEYELVLKTDLYTNRHTQWFYFRVQRVVPGVTYKFNIVNLLKRDSLYNHGMRPLLYSEKNAQEDNSGWIRTGHHISYSRNYNLTRNPLLHPEMVYYVLEWQMEFPHENDTCYLAHCYPYTFTDLKEHLDHLITDPDRKKYIKREVLCETRAGNSCFLVTVSAPEDKNKHEQKKGVVVSARVHPGETNSSWMMKGLLDFLTSNDLQAKDLRKNFVFKIVPMLNPDGVIVGNYRCSLAARDLNRNYRHPRKESFPTIWHTKNMMEEFSREHELVVYCDLHGHSRKHNVFIYGCNTQTKDGENSAAIFLQERLFPWILSVKAPDKFSFRGCKFQVKKCKESTGRVVMWRQMGIMNSFTMEATFCGSKNLVSTDPPRHFTTKDFEAMGKHFCEVVLEYTRAKENKRGVQSTSLYTELILELTKQLTHQILEKRGMLPPSMPGFGARIGDSDSDNDKKDQGMNNMKKEKQDDNSRTKDQPKAVLPKNLLVGVNIDSKQSAIQIIDDMSVETIDGCIKILEDLDITKAFAESDSSDSDSEPDPELPPELETDGAEKKHKRKKKKKKRSKSVPETRQETIQSTTLPEVTGAEAERQKKKQRLRIALQPHPDQLRQQLRLRAEAPIQEYRLVELKSFEPFPDIEGGAPMPKRDFNPAPTNFRLDYPGFVNRYQSRSNNGIPMFSQERIEERAAKRTEEMKKLIADRSDREASGVRFSDEVQLQRILALTRSLQQQEEESSRRYKLDDSTNHSTVISFKHGYTHAATNANRGLPITYEYTAELVGSSEDEDEKCKHGSASPNLHFKATIKSPYTLMSGYSSTSPNGGSNSPPARYFPPRRGAYFQDKSTDISKAKAYLRSQIRSEANSPTKYSNVFLRTGAGQGNVQHQMKKPVSADVFSSTAVQKPTKTLQHESSFSSSKWRIANAVKHPIPLLVTSNSTSPMSKQKIHSTDTPHQHNRYPPVEDISTKPLPKRSDGSVDIQGSNKLTPAYTDVLLERLRMHNQVMVSPEQAPLIHAPALTAAQRPMFVLPRIFVPSPPPRHTHRRASHLLADLTEFWRMSQGWAEVKRKETDKRSVQSKFE
ncbi:uncharacterized protein [Ptychodera flava]|uniref:uncharacterized protein isoform X2 n=1 Tax=Ptychodera flava TaxID=63121 RepID=UPI003969D400